MRNKISQNTRNHGTIGHLNLYQQNSLDNGGKNYPRMKCIYWNGAHEKS